MWFDKPKENFKTTIIQRIITKLQVSDDHLTFLGAF